MAAAAPELPNVMILNPFESFTMDATLGRGTESTREKFPAMVTALGSDRTVSDLREVTTFLMVPFTDGQVTLYSKFP